MFSYITTYEFLNNWCFIGAVKLHMVVSKRQSKLFKFPYFCSICACYILFTNLYHEFDFAKKGIVYLLCAVACCREKKMCLQHIVQSVVPLRSYLTVRGNALHEYLSSLAHISRLEDSRLAESAAKTKRRR